MIQGGVVRDKQRDSGELISASIFVLMWREERLLILSKAKERSLGTPYPRCCVKSKLKEEDVEIVCRECCWAWCLQCMLRFRNIPDSSPDCSVPRNSRIQPPFPWEFRLFYSRLPAVPHMLSFSPIAFTPASPVWIYEIRKFDFLIVILKCLFTSVSAYFLCVQLSPRENHTEASNTLRHSRLPLKSVATGFLLYLLLSILTPDYWSI